LGSGGPGNGEPSKPLIGGFPKPNYGIVRILEWDSHLEHWRASAYI
jgi:hypothetical protein